MSRKRGNKIHFETFDGTLIHLSIRFNKLFLKVDTSIAFNL